MAQVGNGDKCWGKIVPREIGFDRFRMGRSTGPVRHSILKYDPWDLATVTGLVDCC